LKLEELNAAMVTRAIDAYLELAYGPGSKGRDRPDLALQPETGGELVLGLFQRETVDAREEGGVGLCRFTMRLGNRNYPFMKLLMQEHIVPGEFYFAVDTHDHLDIKPDFPDYDAWQAVRRFNNEMKRKIEARFLELGLPTAATIRDLCRGDAASAAVAERPIAGRVLVVDDEEHLAEAVARILERRGSEVHQVHDGPSAVEAARRLLPDLMVLDYELPEMDGLEVLAALRADPETAGIPVLLCTSSKVSVADVRRADGFLAKPFGEALLCEMVDRVLRSGPRSRSEVGP
jgi:CheY-like chemotaxis protein